MGSIFEESDGAIVYRGEKVGLHTRVFINKLGLPTYEAKELGLAPAKYQDWQYDRSIIVTGKEITDYFKVLLSALKNINPKLSDITTHIGHGMVRLPEGKMSSRTGNIKTGEWLIQISKDAIYAIIEKNRSNYTKEEQDTIAEACAIASVKYSLLKSAIPADITFDLEKSVSFEGDSGPYLLYTYARCKSVLRKRETGNEKREASNQKDDAFDDQVHCYDSQFAMNLARMLTQFPDVVKRAGEALAPHMLAEYLFPLAQAFNAFYTNCPILPKEGEAITEVHRTRLQLTEATAVVINHGLDLLGIRTVERM
jgi:arginyl-tRNA synthetase